MNPSPLRRDVLRLTKLLFGNVAAFLLLCVLVEGLLSTLLFVRDLFTIPVLITQLKHTKYDPELGWANKPNVVIPDMYGPGVYLTTNSQGFRGSRDVPEWVPAGKRRVICSGDSVTLGFGVDDDHSWCGLLESLDPRLETVNMGQIGYGVDQAYLWYKRDAAALRHHVQLLAPNTDDFRRMQSDTTSGGYGKPILALEDGTLVAKNVPVPPPGYYLPWARQAVRHLGSLRTTEAVHWIRQRLGAEALNSDELPPPYGRFEVAVKVLPKLLEDLKRVNEERSSKLVLVYLPTLNDRHPETLGFWSRFLERQSRALGIPLINLVEVFQKLPEQEALGFYLPDQSHFNAQGNEYVARLIYRRLRELPETSRILFGEECLERSREG